uniref:Uncharacterized protein n=1 Tax=Solanum tuberosum TaxID=4113 RepID=M1DLS8_SOLTU
MVNSAIVGNFLYGGAAITGLGRYDRIRVTTCFCRYRKAHGERIWARNFLSSNLKNCSLVQIWTKYESDTTHLESLVEKPPMGHLCSVIGSRKVARKVRLSTLSLWVMFFKSSLVTVHPLTSLRESVEMKEANEWNMSKEAD